MVIFRGEAFKHDKDTRQLLRRDHPEVPGVPDEDQSLLGALCDALVKEVRIENEAMLLRISRAISITARSKYFVVKGDIDSTGGITTEFWRMPPRIDSPDAAKDYIHSLPEVQLIQGRLPQEAAELVLGEKKQ